MKRGRKADSKIKRQSKQKKKKRILKKKSSVNLVKRQQLSKKYLPKCLPAKPKQKFELKKSLFSFIKIAFAGGLKLIKYVIENINLIQDVIKIITKIITRKNIELSPKSPGISLGEQKETKPLIQDEGLLIRDKELKVSASAGGLAVEITKANEKIEGEEDKSSLLDTIFTQDFTKEYLQEEPQRKALQAMFASDFREIRSDQLEKEIEKKGVERSKLLTNLIPLDRIASLPKKEIEIAANISNKTVVIPKNPNVSNITNIINIPLNKVEVKKMSLEELKERFPGAFR